LVFTLPHVLNPWVQIHDRELYALLFEAVWATLRTVAADPKRLDDISSRLDFDNSPRPKYNPPYIRGAYPALGALPGAV
jgi:hypothetical protein